MNRAKKILETLFVNEEIDYRDVEIMFDQGWNKVLLAASKIAETRAGDVDDPEVKKQWAENAKILKDAANKLPVVHW